jgi:hypothetical protein
VSKNIHPFGKELVASQLLDPPPSDDSFSPITMESVDFVERNGCQFLGGGAPRLKT